MVGQRVVFFQSGQQGEGFGWPDIFFWRLIGPGNVVSERSSIPKESWSFGEREGCFFLSIDQSAFESQD